jgi:hypothetical protein
MRTSFVTTLTGRSVGLFSIASTLSLLSVAGCDTGDIVDQNPDMPAAPTFVGGSPGTGPGPATAGGSPANAGSGGAGAGKAAVGGSGGATVVGVGGGFNPPPAGAGGVTAAGAANGASTGGLVGTPATCKSGFAAVSLEGAPHSVTIDGASSKGALPHFWNTYGIGHMAAFLQTENNWGEILKAHVKDGVANLGLTSIRAHGLFHDDLGIYKEVDGSRVYDFTKSDQIFDFLVENGVQPIVELGSMPSALASDPSLTWFLWKMGTSPPKDFTLWQELVFKFAEHSLQRYGADVVSKWCSTITRWPASPRPFRTRRSAAPSRASRSNSRATASSARSSSNTSPRTTTSRRVNRAGSTCSCITRGASSTAPSTAISRVSICSTATAS